MTTFHVVLLAPEIPQNTGNIGRLCVNADAELHLVKPLGFTIDDAHLRRAGLDYWPFLVWHLHENWQDFLQKNNRVERFFFLSSKTTRNFYDAELQQGDYLIFGSEQHGLPEEFYSRYENRLFTLPMPGCHARCHNLANAASIALYEALRKTSLLCPKNQI